MESDSKRDGSYFSPTPSHDAAMIPALSKDDYWINACACLSKVSRINAIVKEIARKLVGRFMSAS